MPNVKKKKKKTVGHWRRRRRRRSSVAPVSTPPASALHLLFGLRENLGRGRLLGGGEIEKMEPENSSNSSVDETCMVEDFTTLETFVGRSLGTGPIPSFGVVVDPYDCFFNSKETDLAFLGSWA